MSKRASYSERFHYFVDSLLVRGNIALFLSLIIVLFGAIVFIATLRLVTEMFLPDWDSGFLAHIWRVFLQLTDPGNLNEDTEAHQVLKIPAIIACLSGLIIFSALIAVITTALDGAMASLKKGHSRVIEQQHTLILGWGDRIVEILRELVEANESEKGCCVVILSEVSKEEMDEYLISHVPDSKNTRVVTRSGSPTSLQSLRQVSADEIKSAIVLASCRESDSLVDKIDSDAKVIKALLALEAIAPQAKFPIVTEVFNKRNARVVLEIAPGRVSIVDASELLAKIIVQTSRTSGLSVVYAELLSFYGSELYFYLGKWEGMRWGDLQFHFTDGVPIGIRTASGVLQLKPLVDYRMKYNEEVLVVAEDNSTIEFRDQAVIVPSVHIAPDRKIEHKQEKKLIIGWSLKAPIIIKEYADYVLPGSEVVVIVHDPPDECRAIIAQLGEEISKLNVSLLDLDPLDADALKNVQPFSFNNLVVIPQNPGPEKDIEQIDTETILLLLLLRGMRRELADAGETIHTKIVTEVLESSNQTLVNRAGVDDFVISSQMISMIFAQISEEPSIKDVYDDLFREEGSEIYVKPASLYFEDLPVCLPFADLMKVAQSRDSEVCIGWKNKACEFDAAANYGVTLVPEKHVLITLKPDDSLVVLAEDDT